MSIKVCENSLRWVLNMRHGINVIRRRYNETDFEKLNKVNGFNQGYLREKDVNFYMNDLNKFCDNDGHSVGSFYWTYSQAKDIDKIGLDEWLKSQNAKGYLK